MRHEKKIVLERLVGLALELVHAFKSKIPHFKWNEYNTNAAANKS